MGREEPALTSIQETSTEKSSSKCATCKDTNVRVRTTLTFGLNSTAPAKTHTLINNKDFTAKAFWNELLRVYT